MVALLRSPLAAPTEGRSRRRVLDIRRRGFTVGRGSNASLDRVMRSSRPMSDTRNPHTGLPFADDDAAIAAALEDVSIPALMCSLVHMTGDPSWIRGDIRPLGAMLNEYQGYLPDEQKVEVRRRALP